MLEYLNQVFGVSACEEPWQDAKRLPLYLRGNRRYAVLTIDGVKLLAIYVDPSEFSLPAFQKQGRKLKEYWAGETTLCFEKLTSYQRKALIEQRVSFIVPGSQVYLPGMGVVLQERMRAVREKPAHLSAGSQFLLLHLAYREDINPCSKAELARQIGKSGMAITRAVQELSDLGLVRSERAGRCDYVSLAYSGKTLYANAQPYLIDPVQKRLFIRWTDMFSELPLSGERALSERSMLNPPAADCRAISRSAYRPLQAGIETVDPAWCMEQDYIELEIWSYDPKPLARRGLVDVISLAASLAEEKDERVRAAVHEMMEGYKW